MVVEEVAAMGCVGERLLSELGQRGLQLTKSLLCNCGSGFIPHGSPAQLRALCGLDAASLTQRAREVCAYGK